MTGRSGITRWTCPQPILQTEAKITIKSKGSLDRLRPFLKIVPRTFNSSAVVYLRSYWTRYVDVYQNTVILSLESCWDLWRARSVRSEKAMNRYALRFFIAPQSNKFWNSLQKISLKNFHERVCYA